MSQQAALQHPAGDDASIVDELVTRARRAQRAFEAGATQATYDTAALAAAWALMEPARNRELAEMAVETTGLGNVADKITKNHRKTLGLLRDIKRARTQGVIEDDPSSGLTKIARPIGVVGAVVPSTNPAATPVNNVVNALKCGNAIILSPSPKGVQVCEALLAYIHAEFQKAGIDPDLVQMVPAPSSKAKTQRLMELADLLVVTGSQDNVRRAYSSGTPAIGVGAGNVTVIVDETADLQAAAEKIAASKSFDNATSCSSENVLVVVDEVHDRFLEELNKAGGRLLEGEQAAKLSAALFQDGKLNRHMIARDVDKVAAVAGVDLVEPESAKFLVIPGGGIGPEHPESGEKLSLVAALYKARDFQDAKAGRRQRPVSPGRGPLDRTAQRRRWPCRRARSGDAGMPGDRQPGALLRHRRRLQQRHALFAIHGLRQLGRQLHRREPELPPLHERDQGRAGDSGQRACAGRDLRRLLAILRTMSQSATRAARTTDQSVRSLIDSWAERVPERTFLVDPESGASFTYAETRAAAAAVAARLADRGLLPGDSVAYAMGNGAPAALAILGILYGGFLATAVNLVAGRDTLAFVLSHSGARLVIATPATRPMIADALEGQAEAPSLVNVDEDFFRQPDSTAPDSEDVAAQADGLLMYTSGTTGRPRGVVLTHANLIAGGANTAEAHELGEDDRALCVLPLYHINGLCVTLMAPLVSGGSVVIPNRFSVSAFWDTIVDCDCSWFSIVPTQVSYLLHESEAFPKEVAERGRLRFGRSASAPLSPDVQTAFETRFGVPIIETMGLTETAAQILSNPLPPGTRKVGSPGVATGNEVIIGDEAQREVPRGQEGEVLVRGPNVMRGYLKDPEASQAALTPEGWLRTGDLGRMDEDGYVFITGRLKELIIKGGENIAPREVDEALYSHPDVLEAAAFGCDCQNYGQRIEAGVVLISGSSATEDDLIQICRQRIGAFKTPDRIHFLPELPKGPSGKIQRIKLARMV